MKLTITAFALIFMQLAFAKLARAQDCTCDHRIELGENRVDGSSWAPGDTVCIMAGDRPDLVISNFSGSASNYITIINCDGKVRTGSPDAGVGFAINNGKYFHLTGTGHSDFEYGIEVTGSRSGAQGLAIGSFSTDFEVDHIEIHDAGFAGIMSKTDPSCDETDLTYFTQENCHFHHNYIHHVGGEGFYIGYTFYPEREYTCNGQQVILRGHPMRNISVTDNIIENTDLDGIQMSAVISGALIARNIVWKFAVKNEIYQNQGIQIGSGTSGEITRNFIASGPGIGIFWLGWGGAYVHNNIIYETGSDGINCQDRTETTQPPFIFEHNTIIRPGRDGIRIHSTLAAGNRFSNNLVIDPGEAFETHFGDFDFTVEGNTYLDSEGEAGFVSKTDFHLTADSPAINAGTAAFTSEQDYDGLLRDSSPDSGAFCFEGAASSEQPGPAFSTWLENVGSSDGCSCKSPARSNNEHFLIYILFSAMFIIFRLRI